MSTAPAISNCAGNSTAPGADSISVVVPNFNHGRFLDRSIGALLAQHRPPDEIIIIDDASTDDSRDRIRQLAAREPCIRTFFNERNLGVVASTNLGLAEARGHFVTFCAADDIVKPAFLQSALLRLAAHPRAALFCAEVSVVAQDGVPAKAVVRPAIRPSNEPHYFDPKETRRLLWQADHFIVTLTAVYRREALVTFGGFDPVLGSLADGYAARRLALEHGFFFEPRVLATWRISSSGLSRSLAAHPANLSNVLTAVADRITGDPVFPQWYAAVHDRRLRFATCRLALRGDPADWAFVHRLGTRTPLDRAVVSNLSRLPARLGSLGALAWLTLRLRPYSLLRLVETRIRRTLLRRDAETAMSTSG